MRRRFMRFTFNLVCVVCSLCFICATFKQSTFNEFTFLWVYILRVYSTNSSLSPPVQVHVWTIHKSNLYNSVFQALHVLRCRRFTQLMFYRFCFIHFLFCSSTIQPMLYILRVQGAFYGPCFTSPLFTSSRFALSTFESPGFTFPHIGIVHVLDIKFMFCNVHDFWVLSSYVCVT